MEATAVSRNATPWFVGGVAAARYGLQGLLLILVVPAHNVLSDAWHRSAPWADVAAAVLALLVLVTLLRGGESPFAALRWPILLFGLVSLTSVVVNRVPWGTAAAGLRGILPWMVLGLSAAAVFRPQHVPGVLRLIRATGIGLAAYGVLSYLTFRWVGGPFSMPAAGRNLWESVMLYPYLCGAYPVPAGWRLISTFMNDNYFGVWLTLLIPIVYAQNLNEERSWHRLAGHGAVVLMVVACTWTYSRAAALGLVAGIVVLAARGHRAALLLLLPVFIAAPLFSFTNDARRFSNVSATQGGRVQSMQRTLSVLGNSPLLGKGPGTRGLADMNYAKIGYETGALGLAAFAYLLFRIIRPVISHRSPSDPRTERLISGMLAGLIAVAAAGVGGEVWEMPQIAFYFWLVGGLVLVLTAAQQTARPFSMDQVG